MSIKVTGVTESVAKLALVAAAGREAMMAALAADVTAHVFAPSQELVPLDLGPLQASGRVTMDGDTVTVSYGQDDDPNSRGETTAEYAVLQHENLAFNHAPGRQAKYLEQPGLEYTHDAEARLAAEIIRRMPSG